MQRMTDAIDSPAWGELGGWVHGLPELRQVCIWWTRGRWSVSLYEHVTHPSVALVASTDTIGDVGEPLATVASRALAHIEVNRKTTRAAAIEQLRELAGE